MMGKIAYTDKMLATIFRMKESTVTMAMKTFEDFGMVEVVDGVITIPNWNKHQTLDAYERKKMRDRLYQAERRANQRALISKSSDSQATPSSYVAISEEDKEIDKELHSSVIAYLNEKSGKNYRSGSDKTRKHIHARASEGFNLEDFKTVIDSKCTEWMGTDYEKYIRPETLFGPKFEGYLNAAPKAPIQDTGYIIAPSEDPWEVAMREGDHHV